MAGLEVKIENLYTQRLKSFSILSPIQAFTTTIHFCTAKQSKSCCCCFYYYSSLHKIINLLPAVCTYSVLSTQALRTPKFYTNLQHHYIYGGVCVLTVKLEGKTYYYDEKPTSVPG